MPSNHLTLCRPLLFPPSIFPSIRVFPHTIADVIRQIKLDPSVGSMLTLGESVCHKNSIPKEQFCPNAFWSFGSYTPSCPTASVLSACLLLPVYNLSKVPTTRLPVSASLGVSQHGLSADSPKMTVQGQVHGDPDSLQRALPLPLGLLLVHLKPVLYYSPSPTAPCSLVTASTHTIRGRTSRLETTILPRGPTFSISFSTIASCGTERMFSLVNARREQV